MIRKIALYFLLTTALVVSFLAAAGYWLVVVNPGKNLSRSYLQHVLAVESPVYYKDGHQKIGVFFQNSHRQYIPFGRIPPYFIKSIVAAEDSNFYHHWGVDFMGVLRAMYANIRAGRVVQGGSTLTQQTAKNLYKRRGRSFKAKAVELLNAWRLEYHYSKNDILEFYSNQFYVSGNGRGLGVAARYYFDKPATELGLLECAFIAGSVKRPNYYNPFTKKSPEAKARARARAKARCRYVLNRMFELGFISAAEYQRAIDREVPFKRGRMSYALNSIMDMVKEALDAPEVQEALVAAGIDNIASSGIRVVTTIDKRLQEMSLAALRHELSRLTVRMQGYKSGELQSAYSVLAAKPRELAPGSFVFGRIERVERGREPLLLISLMGTRSGQRTRAVGVIDRDGLQGVLTAQVKYKKSRWSTAGSGDMKAFLAGFAKGELVYGRIREYDAIGDRYLLDLERYPEVEGGVLVLEDGRVRALAGGNENHFFNRTRARRLMGSVSKPLLYTAAIQLGWNSMDLLDNRRNAFVYNSQTYFPSPDHHSPFAGVSMNWAGTKSENVASVWLLYHLCDRLGPGQFMEVAQKSGMARRDGESYDAYRRRIRDKYGILVDQEKIAAAAMKAALEDIEPDLLFSGLANESDFLHQLQYSFADNVVSTEKTGKEFDLRRRLVKVSYVSLERLATELSRYRQVLAAGEEFFAVPEGPEEPARLYVDQSGRRYAYGRGLDRGVWRPIAPEDFRQKIANTTGGWNWDGVLLEGRVSAATFNSLRDAQKREFRRLARLPRYGAELLSKITDFRILTGLRYLIGLCRELGVESPLEPVLSFPLGSNVISLFDVARAYETVIKGERLTLGRPGGGEALSLIARIEDKDGRVIYRPQLLRKRVVDPKTSLSVSNIMRNVVRFGTGRAADREIFLPTSYQNEAGDTVPFLAGIPVMGKTGTANGYRNAAFAGFVPELEPGKGAVVSRGYTVAAYAGYDDNRPMVRNSSRIAGSAGALPIWIGVAKALVRAVEYRRNLDGGLLIGDPPPLPGSRVGVPLSYSPLGQIVLPGEGLADIVVDEPGKITYFKGEGRLRYGDSLTVFAARDAQGNIYPERYFRPYWRAE